MRRTGLMAWHVTALCSVLVACNDTGSLVGTPALSLIQDNKSVAMACSPELLPSNETNVGCCQDGNRMWATMDGHRMGYRLYDAPPCREADGLGTNCGVGSDPFKPCDYGPCGARIEWRVTAEAIHIFQPVSKPEKCGWQITNVTTCLVGCDWPVGSNRSNPEPFAGQALYAGLTGTCPYRRCLRGGTPAP
jgi:hypothetical protein